MSLFEYISVAISIILALGIAKLLTGLIELLRHREQVRFHWVPLLWALVILIIQFQFWWQIYALDSVLASLERSWRNVDYIVMVLYTITLFVAGSLILPAHYAGTARLELLVHFQREGKFALVALLGYIFCGVLLNLVLLGVPWNSAQAIMSVLISLAWTIPIIGALLSRSETAMAIWTLLFAAVGIAVWYLTVIGQHQSS